MQPACSPCTCTWGSHMRIHAHPCGQTSLAAGRGREPRPWGQEAWLLASALLMLCSVICPSPHQASLLGPHPRSRGGPSSGRGGAGSTHLGETWADTQMPQKQSLLDLAACTELPARPAMAHQVRLAPRTSDFPSPHLPAFLFCS